MLSILIALLISSARSHADYESHSRCAEVLAEIQIKYPRLPREVLRELSWDAHEYHLVARPIDPLLHDKLSVRLTRSPMTEEWDLSVRVRPKGFEEMMAVSFAFELMQKRRMFEVGFTDQGEAGELPKGIVANFYGDASADQADVEDGFEVLKNVFAAFRGRGPKPRLN